MHNEDEATKLWCPFSVSAYNSGGNRCIASACMAWRRSADEMRHDDKGEPLPPQRAGYCGLAGRVE